MLCLSFTEATSAAFGKRLSEGFPEKQFTSTNIAAVPPMFPALQVLPQERSWQLLVISSKSLEVCRAVLTWHHVKAPILSTAKGDEQAAGFPLSPLTHTMLIQKLRETADICVN